MNLHTEKILNELNRLGKKQIWLADKIGLSRQAFYEMMQRKSIRHVDKISEILLIDKRYLVKF